MEKLLIKQQQKWGEDVYSLLSWFDLEKVRNAKVMVVGAGALGNEVLKNLALFGIGNIVIVDYDFIEFSNLSRSVLFRKIDADKKRSKAEVAAERIREINQEIKVFTVHGNVGTDVGLGIFLEMDAIIGCLDSRYARFLINQHAFRANKPWIDGGIENLEGYPPDLVELPVRQAGAQRCVDVGHLWLDGHDPLPHLHAAHAPAVIHLHGVGYDPARGGLVDHQALDVTPPAQLDPVCRWLVETQFAGVVTLEVFGPGDFARSLSAFRAAMQRVTAAQMR